MKRSTAVEMAVKALGVEMLPSNNDHILAMADVLQRECDQREGLIEMADALISRVQGWGQQSNEWRDSVVRWTAEKEKLLKP